MGDKYHRDSHIILLFTQMDFQSLDAFIGLEWRFLLRRFYCKGSPGGGEYLNGHLLIGDSKRCLILIHRDFRIGRNAPRYIAGFFKLKLILNKHSLPTIDNSDSA